ncbi:unnamed protein product, partial [Urochloa humidicola]
VSGPAERGRHGNGQPQPFGASSAARARAAPSLLERGLHEE